ncbi:RDD family protein [Nocardioides perillae]|uniref:Putative RDD family membrane protein YckC n=1 Tax=Nocardioides perillae TaxID=1119534 RepID=A0A7Y9UV69_9ACTN|nr:RDD family protein [Nocardioides perillae]NYG55635.1 putative RDD family membrane protein YckC [Nocardioides perillae]
MSPAQVPWQLETATWPRRAGALLVDWLAAVLVVIAVTGLDGYLDDRASGFYVMAVYWLQASLFTALAGGSFGQLATRLRVVRQAPDGTLTSLPVLPSLLRHALVLLVIPPLVFRPDGRGLHDLATRSGAVTLAALRAGTGR